LRASAAVERAQARSRIALARILPRLTAQGGFQHQFFTVPQPVGDEVIRYPFQDLWTLTGELEWTAIDLGAFHAIGTNDRNVAAAELDLGYERRILAMALVDGMLTTLAGKRAAELHRSGLRSAIERFQLTQQRVQRGSGTELDLERARQDIAAARSALITGDEGLRQAREALGLALGSSVATAAPGDLALDQFEAAVAVTCRPHSAFEERPDVATARARVELADRAIEEVGLSFAPTLAVQSQLLWGSEVLYGRETVWSVGAVLRLPVWDGGERYGLLRDARAAADQARRVLQQTRVEALVEIGRTARGVAVSRAALEVAEQQRAGAKRVDQLTRAGYQSGFGTSLDLVSSAEALRRAELDLTLAVFRASHARVLALLSHADCVY
jgi:outer membrane protein TolC